MTLRRMLWLSLALISLTATRVFAQTEDPVHSELRTFRDALMDAVVKGDLERELTYLHPNVVVTWHNAEVSRGREGVRAYLGRMLSGPDKVVDRYSIDLTVDELSILHGGDTAVSWGGGVEHFQLTNGQTFDLPARWSATLVKEDGRWLVANLHSSDNLFDNPMLSMARTMTYWTGGVSLVIGVGLGLVLARVAARRRRTAA